MGGPARVIAHLDCDAFFATVELLRRPELRGLPVIVAGGGPRSVVTTASYEARAFGVGSGMPARRALRLCPDAVVIPPDGAAYREASRGVWDVVASRLERVQRMGIDEAYADLTGTPRPVRLLRAVVEEVREATGIQISVGLGPSRLVAKCCSDVGKPAAVDTNGFSVEGLGKVLFADVAIAKDRVFFAVEKAGEISLVAYANATTIPTPLREVTFSREPRIPTVANVRDGRVAVAATETRVAVAWTTARVLTSNDAAGGYAVFACAD